MYKSVVAILSVALVTVAGTDNWVSAGRNIHQVSQGSQKEVWGTSTEHGRFCRWQGGQDWVELKGKLQQFDVAADGSVWGIGTTGDVYRFNGQEWREERGNLRQLSAANSNDAWGVDREDRVWHWEDGRWAPMPGKLRQVEVGSDGQLWGVGPEQQVYQWDNANGNGGWTEVPGHFVQISAEPNNVWALSESGEPFQLEGQQWVRHEGNFRYIHAAADGSVWATDAGGNAYYLQR